MKYRYLPAAIMLSAGTITILLCLYNGFDTLYSLKLLLGILIIFLIIGSLTRRALIKIMSMGVASKSENTETKEENKEETEEEKPEEANQEETNNDKNDNV